MICPKCNSTNIIIPHIIDEFGIEISTPVQRQCTDCKHCGDMCEFETKGENIDGYNN